MTATTHRIAVAGATGLVGRALSVTLAQDGHEVVPISREHGIDLLGGDGLAAALDGVEAVVDVTNAPEFEAERARAFFGTVSANLLAAERAAGVAHHVVLSIVGVDRVSGNGHYAGKLRQEEVAQGGDVPVTILRATQFFDFAEMVVGWTRRDDVAIVPPLLVQPLAVADVAARLAEIAAQGPGAGRVQLAGPEPQDLVDMARRTLAARGEHGVRLRPSWTEGPFDAGMAGDVLLPQGEVTLAATTFEQWLGQLASHT